MTSPADRSGDIGSKLRGARERKGVSLRQVANQTKISVAALEALERNDFSRLPGGIFSRAFVRSYAVEVGLDPEATIQEFVAQFPQDALTAGHSVSDDTAGESIDGDRRTAVMIVWILAIGIPLAAAVLYFSMARRAPAATTAPESLPAPIREAAPEPSAPPATIRSAGQDAVTPASAVAAPAAAAPLPVPAVPAVVSPEPPSVPTDHLTVVLSARRPVWVSATVDGQKAIERLLQPGDQQRVEIRREMALTAGDAGALTLTLNGAEARPLGRTGEVVTTRLNLTNFKDYLQTR